MFHLAIWLDDDNSSESDMESSYQDVHMTMLIQAYLKSLSFDKLFFAYQILGMIFSFLLLVDPFLSWLESWPKAG